MRFWMQKKLQKKIEGWLKKKETLKLWGGYKWKRQRKLFGEIVRSSFLWHIHKTSTKMNIFSIQKKKKEKKTSSAEARAKSNEAIGVENWKFIRKRVQYWFFIMNSFDWRCIFSVFTLLCSFNVCYSLCYFFFQCKKCILL